MVSIQLLIPRNIFYLKTIWEKFKLGDKMFVFIESLESLQSSKTNISNLLKKQYNRLFMWKGNCLAIPRNYTNFSYSNFHCSLNNGIFLDDIGNRMHIKNLRNFSSPIGNTIESWEIVLDWDASSFTFPHLILDTMKVLQWLFSQNARVHSKPALNCFDVLTAAVLRILCQINKHSVCLRLFFVRKNLTPVNKALQITQENMFALYLNIQVYRAMLCPAREHDGRVAVVCQKSGTSIVRQKTIYILYPIHDAPNALSIAFYREIQIWKNYFTKIQLVTLSCSVQPIYLVYVCSDIPKYELQLQEKSEIAKTGMKEYKQVKFGFPRFNTCQILSKISN